MSTVLDPAISISPEVKALNEEVVALRRDFHAHPELLFDLPYTSAKVAEYLKALPGVEVRTGIGQSGIVAMIDSGKPGKTVLYRADMDALPLLEETGAPYASKTKGLMHACGHDGHTAVALVMAKILSQQKGTLKGKAAILFQPAEEGGDGAGAMIKDGVMDWIKPDITFAMHLNNDEPVGVIGARVGGVYAGSNEFEIKLTSKGGHGAAPHQAPDLIVVGSHLILALQTVISRSVDPCDTAVVTIGKFHAGTKSNILPTEAYMEGTVRTFDKKLTDHIKDRIDTIAKAIGQAHGAGVEFSFRYNYPPTINAPGPTALVREVAEDLVGKERVSDFWTTGSEDMSRFLDLVPGCYWSVGSRHPDASKTYPHHSGRFNPEEDALPLGVELGLRVIRKALA
jgi:amidohydrolase